MQELGAFLLVEGGGAKHSPPCFLGDQATGDQNDKKSHFLEIYKYHPEASSITLEHS